MRNIARVWSEGRSAERHLQGSALDALDPDVAGLVAEGFANRLPAELTEDMMKKARWIFQKLGKPVPDRLVAPKPKK